MRVLWVLHTPRDPTSGVFAAVTADAEALRAREHQVEILTPGDLLSGWRRSPRWLPLVWPWAALWWILRRPPFDVLIFHSFAGWGPALVRRWPARLAKAVFATQFHGLEPLSNSPGPMSFQSGGEQPSRLHLLYRGPVISALLASACRRSDLVLCLNGAERSYLVERQWAKAESVRIVHPPVPLAFFLKRDYGRGLRHLLFVGQWQARKGIVELVEALRVLRSEGSAIRLVCAGTRLPEESVRAGLPAALQHAVDVIPEISRERLPGLFEAADAFVLPSYSEGSSVALREAMASGMPIVASPVGACPDLLRDRESVLLVSPGDPIALADAIAEFARDESLRRRCGEGARVAADRLQAEQHLVDLLETAVLSRHGKGSS